MIEAIKFGHEAIKKQCQAQENLAKKCKVGETREYDKKVENEEILKKIESSCYDKIYKKLPQNKTSKQERTDLLKVIKDEVLESFRRIRRKGKGNLVIFL